MGEHEFFRIVALVAVLLLVLPAAVPSMRPNAWRIRQAGAWILAIGMVAALFLVAQWLLAGGT